MGELNTVTISLDRFENLLHDSYELKQANTNIANIRSMVFEEIADDCWKYGERYADGTSTAIMCRDLFRVLGISDPSKNPTVQDALREYEEEKARKEE